MSGHDLEARRSVAVETARAAGRLLMDYRSRRLTVETKSSETDPVSEADRASEALVVARLTDAFPDDGFVGEEAQGNRTGSSGLRWVVDPLDGTVNYLYGFFAWCVSIGCEDDDGTPVVGVVHHPLANETFVAVAGSGARVLGPDDAPDAPGTPLAVSSPTSIGMAMVATGYNYDPDVRREQAQRVAGLAADVRDVRRAGAAALDLAWTAAGRLDGYGEHGLAHWDWSAGALLVREAGGDVVFRDHQFAGRTMPGIFAGSPSVVARLLEQFD